MGLFWDFMGYTQVFPVKSPLSKPQHRLARPLSCRILGTMTSSGLWPSRPQRGMVLGSGV